MKLRLALASAVATLAIAGVASATPIAENSGWQNDQIDSSWTPSEGSAWTFTVSDSAMFSVEDGYIPGDTYKLYDSSMNLLATSTFTPGSASDVQASADYFGSLWTDKSYSRLVYHVGPGSYSLTVEGDGIAGLPAGLGVRLDSAAVPEPATWAVMLMGLFGLGAALRRRREGALAA